MIHAALLPRLIGFGRARWLVMTAENIDAPTALAWGLVDHVAPSGGLDDAVEHTVKALLECGVGYVAGYQGAPISHLMDVLADAEEILEGLGVHFEASASEAGSGTWPLLPPPPGALLPETENSLTKS